ncbi:MAG: phosphoglycerate kinase [Dehalococcoidales bacterium]|jgi:phosphoglycerate kinase|nr:phosphoglycerate kinase [Dehalococcoidales bacterium]MDP7109894.1 phosphoglycerate kinase [Dehalococcoidales bacterium]MDP7309824.1 phosphoglycerate kinase [Dehalococcoidales bacterium]MDP7409770.1 phosphoglycerate kinase [Dehalococcoidales bacterium]MDP7676135.1 phosphoglycerate kinase [Dehalococcoidales bacterium]|tara:strand:+ start:2100 stop:3317 length:1218 start_codon:yes stop_codon:yes gene_type:complete
MKKLTVRDVDVAGKKVFVRVDFNVPIDENTRAVTDEGRIRATLPTIQYLLDCRAKIILCSHLGRPDGKVVETLRMTTVAQRLSQILGQAVSMAKDCIGTGVEESVANLEEGQVLLLENVRFHPEEEFGASSFAQALAKLADIYVNDAFGASHRRHASIVGITEYLPSVAGLLLAKEIDTLNYILEDPAHPFAALVGGANGGDKMGTLENIMNKVDFLIVGGGMAAPFLKAESYETGQSIVETGRLDAAAGLIDKARRNGVRLLFPVDVVVADEMGARATGTVVSVDEILPRHQIVDIGYRTIQLFKEALRRCQTVFWNGPMGIFELPQFAEGTKAMANELACLKATTVIGGGSTAEIVTSLGLTGKMTFVSTGGGASMQYLGSQKLPGVEVLLDKNSPVAAKLRG